MPRFLQVCLLAASPLICLPLRAEHTRFWRQSNFAEFEKGTAKGVALRSDGTLTPAPRFEPFADPNLAYLWALRADSRGRLYAAGGSNAKVLRFDAQGKDTTVFESSELEAQTIALDSRDNLYVGTSPDGKVYKVTSEGQRSVFFNPETKYIWALATDQEDNLFVGTGDKGEIFVVSPDGKGGLFCKTQETHARSLAFDLKGNLLVGTDPAGLILRVDVIRKKGLLPRAGSAFVLYETDKKEVTALAVDPSGNIYAGADGAKAPPRPVVPTLPVTPAQPTPAGAAAGTVAGNSATFAIGSLHAMQMAPTILAPFPSLTGGSEVYRLAPDGSPESLWSSHDDLIYALGFSPSGKLLLGTGNHGEVIELEHHGIFSSLAKTASAQVTALAPGPDGIVYLATANPGKIFTLGSGYATEGAFVSEPFDAKIFSRWGKLTWWGENGAMSGKVEFYVRSGNTSDTEHYWSSWSGPYSTSADGEVQCPSARFVQWKAVFHQADSAPPLSLSWVALAYLPKNVAPVIDDIVIQKPGVRVQEYSAPALPPGTSFSPVPLRMPQAPGESSTMQGILAEYQRKQPKFEAPPQGFAQKGYETVLWSAHDANDDNLIFALYYRGEGEKTWKLLKDRIRQRFYSWDTTTMPDGAYYLKLVASDSPSNPPDQALTAEREGDRFVVDNSPPEIVGLRAQAGNGDARVLFTARDPSSVLARVAYSLDAGSWTIASPVGELTDSRVENYDLTLKDLSPGEHTIAVQVSDEFENSATAKVTFIVAQNSH